MQDGRHIVGSQWVSQEVHSVEGSHQGTLAYGNRMMFSTRKVIQKWRMPPVIPQTMNAQPDVNTV